jgi:hypothetical protein
MLQHISRAYQLAVIQKIECSTDATAATKALPGRNPGFEKAWYTSAAIVTPDASRNVTCVK